MADKQMVSAKIRDRTVDRLESYAEREGVSRSQAVDDMVKQGLDVEESDMRLVPIRSDGGTVLEDKIESNRQKIEEVIESETESNREDIEELLQKIDGFGVVGRPILVSLFWIGIQVSIGIPNFGFSPWVTVVSGLLLMAWVLYAYSKVYFNG